MVTHANCVPSGENYIFFTLIANFVFLLILFALSFVLAPGIFESALFLISQASSSRSESISISWSATSSLMFLEFSFKRTPSKLLFYVIANLLNIILFLISYKQMFFEFPPPITNSPLGDILIELKCLFLVEFLDVYLSFLSLPPSKSFLHSIIPLMPLASWSQT